MELRKIKLYGKLAKLFGKEWNLAVKTVGEAIRAIDINTKGKFSEYLRFGAGAKKYYKVGVKKKDNLLTEHELNKSFGSGDIYIMPTITGNGKYGMMILGVVMVAVGAYFGQGWLMKMGVSMILGGICQLLAPSSKVETQDQRNSYLFQGNASTIFQGSAVGVVYGRALVSPMPICTSINNMDVSLGENITPPGEDWGFTPHNPFGH